jgi:hypothetical protein
MRKETEAEDMVAGVEQMAQLQATSRQCQVTVVNGCPAGWAVTIVSAAVKFFYRDGTACADGPRPVNLPAGQSAAFLSSDPNRSVHQFFVAMVVLVAGRGSRTLTLQDGITPGDLLLYETVVLGPQPGDSPDEVQTQAMLNLLALSRG